MTKEPTLESLQKQLQDLQAKRNQIIGKRDSLLERLRKEFGVSTIAEAENKILELEAQQAEQEAEVTKLKAEYESI
jgi:hypothetical protein